MPCLEALCGELLCGDVFVADVFVAADLWVVLCEAAACAEVLGEDDSLLAAALVCFEAAVRGVPAVAGVAEVPGTEDAPRAIPLNARPSAALSAARLQPRIGTQLRTLRVCGRPHHGLHFFFLLRKSKGETA